MKNIVFSVALLGLLISSPLSADEAKTPKAVVNEFVNMGLTGKRLTAEGSREAARLLVAPSSWKNIFVVSDDYDTVERAISNAKTEVDIDFHRFYGELDPSLRFEDAPGRSPAGALLKNGLTAKFMIVTNHSNGEPAEWKIESLPPGLYIDVRNAVRYVTEMRDKATDPVIKKNAETTLGVLQAFKE
jgi:hypothetical protein